MIDETVRSFDTSKPAPQQARAALRALEEYDSELSRQYRQLLVAYTSGEGSEGAYTFCDFAPDHPRKDEPVSAENVTEAIIAGCKHLLWGCREVQLLALRAGFSTTRDFSSPLDLVSQLQPFPTPELMLLVQGRTEPVTVAELVEQCIKWPDESLVACYAAVRRRAL